MNISPATTTPPATAARPELLYDFADVGADWGVWLDGDRFVGPATGFTTESQAIESAKLLSAGEAPSIVVVQGEDQRFHLQSVIWQHEHENDIPDNHACSGDFHPGMFQQDESGVWPPARPTGPNIEPEYLSFTENSAAAVVDGDLVILPE